MIDILQMIVVILEVTEYADLYTNSFYIVCPVLTNDIQFSTDIFEQMYMNIMGEVRIRTIE